jgi:hypothetical protein
MYHHQNAGQNHDVTISNKSCKCHKVWIFGNCCNTSELHSLTYEEQIKFRQWLLWLRILCLPICSLKWQKLKHPLGIISSWVCHLQFAQESIFPDSIFHNQLNYVSQTHTGSSRLFGYLKKLPAFLEPHSSLQCSQEPPQVHVLNQMNKADTLP